MCLPRKLLGVPTARDSLEPLSLRHSDAVNHLILLEHVLHRDGLLEVLLSPVNLVSDAPTVQLDLHDVGLLAAVLHQLHLECIRNQSLKTKDEAYNWNIPECEQ